MEGRLASRLPSQGGAVGTMASWGPGVVLSSLRADPIRGLWAGRRVVFSSLHHLVAHSSSCHFNDLFISFNLFFMHCYIIFFLSLFSISSL